MAKNKKIKKTALQEQAGIEPPQQLNSNWVKSIKEKRKKQPSVDDLVKDITNGNITALSRAITLIESSNPKHYKKAQKRNYQVLGTC